MRGMTALARPWMRRIREEGYPAASKARRASRWSSLSTSMVVRTPSRPMPPSSHRPDTPVPVPISAMLLAPTEAARTRSAAPVATLTGSTPRPIPRRRAWVAASSSRGNSSV